MVRSSPVIMKQVKKSKVGRIYWKGRFWAWGERVKEWWMMRAEWLQRWCNLENRVRVRSRSLEMAPFDRSRTTSYSPSIAIMALSCIVCEIYIHSDLLVENREIFIPNLYLAPLQGVTPSEFRDNVWCDKSRMIGLPYGEKTMTIC